MRLDGNLNFNSPPPHAFRKVKNLMPGKPHENANDTTSKVLLSINTYNSTRLGLSRQLGKKIKRERKMKKKMP